MNGRICGVTSTRRRRAILRRKQLAALRKGQRRGDAEPSILRVENFVDHAVAIAIRVSAIDRRPIDDAVTVDHNAGICLTTVGTASKCVEYGLSPRSPLSNRWGKFEDLAVVGGTRVSFGRAIEISCRIEGHSRHRPCAIRAVKAENRRFRPRSA